MGVVQQRTLAVKWWILLENYFEMSNRFLTLHFRIWFIDLPLKLTTSFLPTFFLFAFHQVFRNTERSTAQMLRMEYMCMIWNPSFVDCNVGCGSMKVDFRFLFVLQLRKWTPIWNAQFNRFQWGRILSLCKVRCTFFAPKWMNELKRWKKNRARFVFGSILIKDRSTEENDEQKKERESRLECIKQWRKNGIEKKIKRERDEEHKSKNRAHKRRSWAIYTYTYVLWKLICLHFFPTLLCCLCVCTVYALSLLPHTQKETLLFFI